MNRQILLILICLRREKRALPMRAASLGANAIVLSAFDDNLEYGPPSLFSVDGGPKLEETDTVYSGMVNKHRV